MAAARAGSAVTGWDAVPGTLAEAAARGSFRPAGSLEECVADAEIAVVCTPIDTIASVVAAALAASPSAVVTDAGSVKVRVMDGVAAACDGAQLARFVGGHPMGGSERSGPGHASPAIVDGIAWVLTPGERTAPGSVDLLERWIRTLGAVPVRMEARRHDRLVAFVSHLPQVASTTLMGLAATEEASEPEILLLAAGGFRDLTRLAASNPRLWGEILLANRDAIVEAIDLYVERLASLRALVAGGRRDAVEEALSAAKAARLSLAAKPRVRAGMAVLQIEVPDRPGALAQVTGALADGGVNIEDLSIVHSPEGGRGAVHLTVAAVDADVAAGVLGEHGFDPTRLA
jgi:prephenate dehydrogenase